MEATLYTHEGAGTGLTSINVCRVKGAARLKVRVEGRTLEYPIKGGPATTTHAAGSPAAGKADLRLQMADEDIDLARCKGAVALTVTWGLKATTTIYWIEDGRCSEIEHSAFAHAQVEARHCQEYDLPPQIP